MNVNWNFTQCYWVTVNYYKIGSNDLAIKKIMQSVKEEDPVNILISFFVYSGLNRNESLEMKFLKGIKNFDPDLDAISKEEFLDNHQDSVNLSLEDFIGYFCSKFDLFDTLQKLNLKLARRYNDDRNLYVENF